MSAPARGLGWVTVLAALLAAAAVFCAAGTAVHLLSPRPRYVVPPGRVAVALPLVGPESPGATVHVLAVSSRSLDVLAADATVLHVASDEIVVAVTPAAAAAIRDAKAARRPLIYLRWGRRFEIRGIERRDSLDGLLIAR